MSLGAGRGDDDLPAENMGSPNGAADVSADDVALNARDSPGRLELWMTFVDQINARSVAEIGVSRGAFAAHLLAACPAIEIYYMVDPWRHLDDWNKPANRDDDTFGRFFAEAMHNTRDHEQERVVLPGRTTEVIDQIPDGALISPTSMATTRSAASPWISSASTRRFGMAGGSEETTSRRPSGSTARSTSPRWCSPSPCTSRRRWARASTGSPTASSCSRSGPRTGSSFIDVTGTYGRLDLLSQLKSRRSSPAAAARRSLLRSPAGSLLRKARSRMRR